MYGDKAQVRKLAANITSGLTDDEIEAAAAIEDATLDIRLGEIYFWPVRSNGEPYDPIPQPIVVLASIMTAAFLEEVRYAQNAAIGSDPNPYAVALRKRADALLNDILNERARVPGLERCVRFRSKKMAREHVPVPARWPRGGSW